MSDDGTVIFKNFDKRTELNKKKKKTYKKYFAFICKIDNPSTFNWTDLMNEIISGDDMAQSLVRKDKTSLLYSIFKNKYNIITTIQGALKITENIETRILKTENVEQKMKDKITLILKVHKKDMQNFYQHQITFIQSKTITSTNYWIYLNETARASIQTQTSWMSQLLLPVFYQKMHNSQKKSLSLWLANQYTEFDIGKIKSYNRYKYNDNKNNNKFKYKRNPNNFKQRQYKANPIQISNDTKQMFAHTNKILKNIFPNNFIKWDRNFCGFWNTPQINCSRGNCKKKHECPICEVNTHKIGTCTADNINKYKIKNNIQS